MAITVFRAQVLVHPYTYLQHGDNAMKMNNYDGKAFLATVRGEDFAHAGEEEAIDLAFAGLGAQSNWHVLDAGCGRGGTADYVHRHGWGHVVGIDIEGQSIEYAQKKYPTSEFHVCDICDAGATFPQSFDLIYSFNAYYAVPHKRAAMDSLCKAAKPGALLCLFDYVTYKPESPIPDVMLSDQPATEQEFSTFLEAAGWRLEENKNLDQKYIEWYRNFLSRFDAQSVKGAYPQEMIEQVRHKYADLLGALESGVLGGILLLARAT
jgi:SAM-dependent methyltransferase